MASIIGKRYGNAVFELAKEGEWVDTLETQINLVEKIFNEKEILSFLGHPGVPNAEKISVIESSLEGKAKEELVGLFILLVQKGRTGYIQDIFEEIHTSIDEYNGKAKVYIKSAYELTDEEKSSIEKRVSDITKKKVVPIYKIDKTLIGGLVIRIGDKVVDSSIKGHLRAMKRSLLEEKAV